MRTTWLLALITGAGVLCGLPAPAADLGIPTPFAAYRSWKLLTLSPQPIPYQLAQLCAAAVSALPKATDHGPHANRWVMVYANLAADAARADAGVAKYPVGAMIAKEKRATAGATHPEGVAFMVKHRKGEFTASDGWEFLYFPSAGKNANYDGCISCHRARAAKDYVFGSYGPPEAAH